MSDFQHSFDDTEPVLPITQVDVTNRYKQTKKDHTQFTLHAQPSLLPATRDNAYNNAALSTTVVAGQEIRTFAPFKPRLSALQTITRLQKVFLQLLGLIYALALVFYSAIGLKIIIAALTLFYVVDLCMYLILSTLILRREDVKPADDMSTQPVDDSEWSSYTILCPLYREAAVVPQFVQAMQALDYPTEKLQILFLTEEDDSATRDAIAALSLPAHFQIVTVPDGQPRTKPRACNFGLLQTTGDYVVIFDAEDVPDPSQLKKAVLAFDALGPETVCIQAKLNFYNAEQNLLTRWFTAEYSSWFDVTLPGLQLLNVPLPLGGTSNHFRTDALREVGAWDAFNVTEDCDLGVRLGHYKLKTAVLDSTTYEEANSQVKNWMRQRSRWIKGYMQTYLVHMRSPLDYLKTNSWREFLSLQLVVGGKTAILLINPLMWMLVLLYVFLHSFVVDAYHTLYPMYILYMAMFCLIFGNFTYTYVHLLGCIKRQQYNLVKWTLLLPIYWLMGSIAAYIALYQLVFKPHYWEKTLHGLHLLKDKLSESLDDLSHSIDGVKIPELAQPTVKVTPISSSPLNSHSIDAVKIPKLAQPIVKVTPISSSPLKQFNQEER
jgi:cellulose synthase/poly-beta-1,6-N-acetylglucosamine synthase-like glycosyltransferase